MEFVEYTIGDLALELKTGKTPKTSNPEYYGDEINWITPGDLSGEKIVTNSERKITKFAIEDRQAFLFPPQTVLISTIGDIGKACIIEEPASSNQQLTGVTVDRSIILPELFYYWIVRSKKLLENKSNKAVIPILNNKLLRRITISFPRRIEDQYKIIVQLDKIQELIDKRIRTIELLDQYTKSLFFEMFGDPVLNTKGFEQTPLSNRIFGLTSGITPSRKNDEFFGGKIPWAKSTDVKGKLIYKTEENITDLAMEKTNAKIYPENSILIAMYGQGKTRGNVGLLKSNASCNQACAVIFPNDVALPIYLFSQLKYSYSYLRSLGKGGNQNNLSLNVLKKVKINIPPKVFQEKYVDLFFKSKSQKEIHQESLKLLNILFQTTLQNAFNPEVEIDEEDFFEDLIQDFSPNDLKKGNRIQFLINWLNKDEARFSNLEKYNDAIEKLFALLDDNSIEQVIDDNETKLKSGL